jgi:hypothetical protein
MNQSRADRRRAARGGPGPRRPHRDPMVFVYAAFAVLIVAIFAVFGLLKLQENRRIAAALATPTPGPSSSLKPIVLISGNRLGKSVFPFGDTRIGGTGAPVDGITCDTMEGSVYHVHSHLALFVNGTQIAIPQYIGVVPSAIGTPCLYWLHTHDAEGIIHIESPEFASPSGGPFTLGNLFDIWGWPLDANNIAHFQGPVTAYVNGGKYDGDPRTIPLGPHQLITLEIGQPVTPPSYTFPAGL